MGAERPPGGRGDERLVQRARGGDLAALDRLVARHREAVLRVTRSVLGDWDQAEDAAQETFLEALRGLSGLREAGKLRPWLCTIARRCAQRQQRRATEHPEHVPLDHAGPVSVRPPEAPRPDDPAVARLRASLAELSGRDRRVLVLHYLDGYSCREVGARLGLATGTVKRILHTCRRHIREGEGIMPEVDTSRGGPRRLNWWIWGFWGGAHQVLNGLLPGAICLAANKQAKSAAAIAREVHAHVAYVQEALDRLVVEEAAARTRNGRYRTNFLALDAADWRALTDGVVAQGAEAADLLEAHLPRLEEAWSDSSLPGRGFPWAVGIWPMMAILTCNWALRRLGGPVPDGPLRASGYRYWLCGHEQVRRRRQLWTTGCNAQHGRDASLLRVAHFWSHGLERESWLPDEPQQRAVTALAGGPASVAAVTRATGLTGGEARASVADMVRLGVVTKRGKRLAPAFPVIRPEDDQVLQPAADAVAAQLREQVITPFTARAGGVLERAGYGHLREQFPLWSWHLGSNVAGEALHHLMARGVLPTPPRPAPAAFCLIGWPAA